MIFLTYEKKISIDGLSYYDYNNHVELRKTAFMAQGKREKEKKHFRAMGKKSGLDQVRESGSPAGADFYTFLYSRY